MTNRSLLAEQLRQLFYSRRLHQWLGLLLALAVHSSSAAQPVQRNTDSTSADLIDTLLARGMTDIAKQICQRHLADAKSGSDEAARWTLYAAQTCIVEMLRDAPDKSPVHLGEAIAMLDQWNAAHPDHPRAPWIEYQRTLASLARARRDVMSAILKPLGDPARDEALKQIVRLHVALGERIKSTSDAAVVQENQHRDSDLANDLNALVREITMRRIETLMLRGELFEPGTVDEVAAANEAAVAAGDLIDSLPIDAGERRDATRLLAEARRRLRQFDEADALIKTLIATNANDEKTIILAARLAIDRGVLDLAGQWLDQANGESNSIDFDLAKLEWLLATSVSDDSDNLRKRIGDALQQIAVRHGDYARRLAERLVLRSGVSGQGDQLDARIVLAQAAQLLRDGKPAAAAEWLSSAARSTTDDGDAIRLATSAAAACRVAKDQRGAADLLREISLQHYQHNGAADLHLQSSVLLADIASVDAVAEQLEESIRTWPNAGSIATTIDWLVRLHQSKGDSLAAARAALPSVDSGVELDEPGIVHAGDLWLQAIVSVPLGKRDGTLDEAIGLLGLDNPSPARRSQAARLQAMFGPPGAIHGLDAENITEPFAKSVLSVRQGAAPELPSDLVAAQDASLRSAIAFRLMTDGNQSTRLRPTIAKAIMQLTVEQPSLPTVLAFGWSGQWQRASELADQIRAREPGNLPTSMSLAAALADANDTAAQAAGLKAWQSLTAQLPQGGPAWHQAKLAMIAAMRKSGDAAAARQLAQYVLLTQPPTDPQVKSLYESAAK